MENLLLTRKEIASLLLALKNDGETSLQSIIHEKYFQSQSNHHHAAILPQIFEKILKIKEVDPGFSLNDIVSLGNQIEYSKFSSTAVQNWVKRDVKEILGIPQKGRKYSIDQMTILFIVEDLKHILDFDSIRKALTFMFNDPSKRHDDLIDPVTFYFMYASIYEELQVSKNSPIKLTENIENMADDFVIPLNHLSQEQQSGIKNYLAVATLSVHTSYFSTLAKSYFNATLFL